MVQILKRLQVFALEMAIGALVGSLGLLQLVYGVPPLFDDPEMLRKFAASLITIGGTVLASGLFRFFFALRLEHTETHIVDALSAVTAAFTSTIAKLQPTGVNARPQDRYIQYRHLHWRTRDTKNRPIWLRFSNLSWRKQVLPFLEADASIDHPEFADSHHFVLAMVELRGCVAIVATRFNPDKTPHGEMAGVYLYPIPISAGPQLFGHLRHLNMCGEQTLSPCILSREVLEPGVLDGLWLDGGGSVLDNLPRPALAVPQAAE